MAPKKKAVPVETPIHMKYERRFVEMWDIYANPKDRWVPKEHLPIPAHVTPFLRDNMAIRGYGQLMKLDFCLESKIDDDMRSEYNLDQLFKYSGCEKFLEGGGVYYPELVMQFFANGLYTRDKKSVSSIVKGKEIKLDGKILGEILGVPSDGVNIDSIPLRDAEKTVQALPPPEKTGIEYNASWMKARPRAINRISHNNIFPRIAHKHYVRKEIVKFIHCLENGIRCDIASLMLERFTECSYFIIFFPSYLTEIFIHFGVDLDNESFRENKAKIKMGNINRIIGQTSKKTKGKGKKIETQEHGLESDFARMGLRNLSYSIDLVGAKVDYSIKQTDALVAGLDSRLKGLYEANDMEYEEIATEMPKYSEYMAEWHGQRDEPIPRQDDDDDGDSTYVPSEQPSEEEYDPSQEAGTSAQGRKRRK